MASPEDSVARAAVDRVGLDAFEEGIVMERAQTEDQKTREEMVLLQHPRDTHDLARRRKK